MKSKQKNIIEQVRRGWGKGKSSTYVVPRVIGTAVELVYAIQRLRKNCDSMSKKIYKSGTEEV